MHDSKALGKKELLAREMLGRVGAKWTLLVLDALDDGGVVRFSRLRERVGGVSQKMLTKTLRELERDGLVKRQIYAVVPPRVDYNLTALGRSLAKSVCEIWKWVDKHMDAVERSRRTFEQRRPKISGPHLAAG
jgi:DNA-binding HxlR family transcriptional regulator